MESPLGRIGPRGSAVYRAGGARLGHYGRADARHERGRACGGGQEEMSYGARLVGDTP